MQAGGINVARSTSGWTVPTALDPQMLAGARRKADVKIPDALIESVFEDRKTLHSPPERGRAGRGESTLTRMLAIWL